ncbi:MAG TPA: ArsB/NhaD family transporter [Symbiobacteriaceae bacterium]|nr:ArsB/NhaD family transporter [Symbiobacteriaceae bacterium]
MLALAAFLLTVVLVLWRPGGVHEAIPALVGAFAMFLLGLVDRPDVLQVLRVVWNSAMTIIATFVMAAVLEGAGFFQWMADRLIDRAGGSGHRLFHLVLAFSACLTLFLNNDGSILLGTPVVLGLLQRFRLSRRAALAYLLGACLIASASSPPIGVSNMANLEAMSLVGISLLEHLQAVLLPALIGLAACWSLLYWVFRRDLPMVLPLVSAATQADRGPIPLRPHPHAITVVPAHGPAPVPLRGHRPPPPPEQGARGRAPDHGFMWFAVAVVVLVRIGFFVAAAVHVPAYVVAVAGAALLLAANLNRRVMDTRTALLQAPWAVMGFAFGMDLVVFGLRNAGVIGAVAAWMGPHLHAAAGAAVLPGALAALTSALLNNHPGLIIGSLTLKQVAGLARHMLDIGYAGVVLGSDLGALVTPVGTLASLIWFHTLRQSGRHYSWLDYLKVTLAVVPLSFALALVSLFGWALLTGL